MDMTLPHTIPYNPKVGAIACLLGVAGVLAAASALPFVPSWLALPISAVLVVCASLLLLRRFVWRRHLTLAGDSMTVPSGFLRLHSIGVRYGHITHIRVARVVGTSVIQVRTVDRQVEIQDIYLPDKATFQALNRFVESAAQSARRAN